MQQEDPSGLPPTNKKFSVPDGGSTQADIDLQDDKDQALQDAFSDETAAESIGMPEDELREGLDKIAFDEHEQLGEDAADLESDDDWREHVEDMDENDK